MTAMARHCLATLHQLDAVLDARRRQVDPRTGKAPKMHAAPERLRECLDKEPDRLEYARRLLIETYDNAFGPEAAQAFAKCIRAARRRSVGIGDTPGVRASADADTDQKATYARRASRPPAPVER